MKPLTITDTHQAPSFGIREHLATLFRHKGKIAIVFCTAVIVATLGTFLVSKVYVASSRVLIQSSRQNLQLGPVMKPGSVAELRPREQVLTEVKIFESPDLADRVVERLGAEYVQQHMQWRWDWARELPETIKAQVKEALFVWSVSASLLDMLGVERDLGGDGDPSIDAAARIRENLEVSPILQTDVFLVEFKSPNPEFAAVAANALVEAYMELNLRLSQPSRAKDFLAEESGRLKEQLQAAVDDLQAYKRKWQIIDIEAQKKLLLERVHKAEISWRQARENALEREERIRGIKAELAGLSENIALSKVTTRNPVVDDLRRRLVGLELEERNYTAESPAIQRVQKEIADIRRWLSVAEGNVEGSQTSGVNSAHLELQKALLLARSEQPALLSSIQSSEENLNRYREALKALDDREVEFRNLQRDVQLKEVSLMRFLEKEEEVSANAILDLNKISNVKPIEAATPPLVPKSPRKKLIIGLSFVVGLVGAIWIAYTCEFFRRTVATKEEAEGVLGKPVLASIWLSKKKNQRFADNLVEFRRLAQPVMKLRDQGLPARLLVTSTGMGEGKSFVTQELAKAIGDAGLRVLIVVFDATSAAASAKQTAGSAKAESPVSIQEWKPSQPQRSSAVNVELLQLPVKSRSDTAYQALGERLLGAAEQFKSNYDVILIDGASLDAQPEQFRAVGDVDGILYVVEAEKTPGFSAARSLEMLEAAGGSVVGIVLNKRRDVIPDWIYTSLLSPRRARAVMS